MFKSNVLLNVFVIEICNYTKALRDLIPTYLNLLSTIAIIDLQSIYQFF